MRRAGSAPASGSAVPGQDQGPQTSTGLGTPGRPRVPGGGRGHTVLVTPEPGEPGWAPASKGAPVQRTIRVLRA